MKALDYIANELEGEGVISTKRADGSLDLSFKFEDLWFTVSDQLKLDGYFAVLMQAGRDASTNAPTLELEFTSPTALGTLEVIKREAKAFMAEYEF